MKLNYLLCVLLLCGMPLHAQKSSDFPTTTTVAPTDYIPYLQFTAPSTYVNKKVTWGNVFTSSQLATLNGIETLDNKTINAPLITNSATFAVGGTLITQGNIQGTPTGGNWDLSNVTLTLPGNAFSSMPAATAVTSDTYMVGDGCVSFGGAILSGTDNTTGFQNALNAAFNSRSRTLIIRAPLGMVKTMGPLVIGREYAVTTLGNGDDFTNVGGPENVAGINILGKFIATGTSPNTWSHGSILQEVLGTYRIDGDIVWPLGVRIISEATPGDIGGPGPWEANPFPVRLIFTKLTGTALYCPQTSSNIMWGIEVFGNCECGVGIGASMLVNTQTNNNTTIKCTGVNGYAFVVGMTVTNAPGRSDFAANTTISTISGAPVRQTGNITASSNTILNVTSLAGITSGTLVWGRGIPNGTTVSSATGTTVTLSANATTTDRCVFTFSRADGIITLTLNHATIGTNTLIDGSAPTFSDPDYPGTNYPLQPGSDFEMQYCYVHGFGVQFLSNYNVTEKVYDCLLLDGLCIARIENAAENDWRNVQFGNKNDYTQAHVGISINRGYGGFGTRFALCQGFNCLKPIDAYGSDLDFYSFGLQGTYGPVVCDVRGGGQVTGSGFYVQENIQSVCFRLHDGQLNFNSIGGPTPLVVSSTTTSGSSTVTVTSTVGLIVGQAVTGTGIAIGSWISSITPTTVSLNQNAIASGATSLTYTSPTVQATVEALINPSYNSNAFIQGIDGTTFLPVSQYPQGPSVTTGTHGNIALPDSSLIGTMNGTGLQGVGNTVYLNTAGTNQVQINNSGFLSMVRGGIALAINQSIVGAANQQVQLGNFGLITLIDANGVNQAHVFTDGFHIDRGGTTGNMVAGVIAVVDATVTATSVIMATIHTVGGVVSAAPFVSSKTAASGFTLTAGAADTSTYDYVIIEH